jgi:hypothetical protein
LLPFCVLILTTAQHEDSLPLNASKTSIESVGFHRKDCGASTEGPLKVCGCSLIPHSMTEKPSWSRLMASRHRMAGINFTDETSGLQVATKAWQPHLKSITMELHRVASSDKVQRTIYPCA